MGHLKILVYLIFLSVIARVLYLSITPIDCWATDSSYHALTGKEIAMFNSIPSYSFFVPENYYWAPPVFHLIEATIYKLIGYIETFKIISLVCSILSIIVCYLLFKQTIGNYKAILATFFISTYPVAFRLSTSIMTDSLTILLSFFTFYSFLLYERTKKTKHAFLLTGSIALLLLSKYSGIVIVGIILIWKLFNRELSKKFFAILLFGVLLASPWYVRNFLNKGDFLYFTRKRLKDRSILQNLKWFYIRFWDSVDVSEFIKRGIKQPPFVGEMLSFYTIFLLPYFSFLLLGISTENKFDKLMVVWLLAYISFSLYYLTTGWDAKFLPRVTTFSMPLLCYLFASGVYKLRKHMLILPYLILVGILLTAFVGAKLYVKYKNEKRFEQSYEWIRNNTSKNSFIVASHPEQVSLFCERKSSRSIPDLEDYPEVYLYNRIKDVSRLSYNVDNYEKVFDDGEVVIYRIK